MNIETAKKILVADDDDFIRVLCSDLLTESGFVVETAVDGLDALDKLKNTDYDLVISDINMPRLDGIDLYINLEKQYPLLKDRFLFITGIAPTTPKARSILSGMKDRLIKKPFNLNELMGTVRTLTGKPAAAGQLKRDDAGKRREERFSWQTGCEIFKAGQSDREPLHAQVQDISIHGMKIRCSIAPAPETGSDILVKLDDSNVNRDAQIIWTKRANDSVFAGLRLGMGHL